MKLCQCSLGLQICFGCKCRRLGLTRAALTVILQSECNSLKENRVSDVFFFLKSCHD